METDLHRVIRTQELSDDHCQYFIYQVSPRPPLPLRVLLDLLLSFKTTGSSSILRNGTTDDQRPESVAHRRRPSSGFET